MPAPLSMRSLSSQVGTHTGKIINIPASSVGVSDRATCIPHPADSASFQWSASEHGPCLNWVRNRVRCDARHFLKQCPLDPLPRPVAAVTAEDTTAPCGPAPVLSVMPAEPVAAAARDFSSLFMGGTHDMQLSDATAVLSVTAVTPSTGHHCRSCSLLQAAAAPSKTDVG